MSNTPTTATHARGVPDHFRKAILRYGEDRALPGTDGYKVPAPTSTEVVGTPDYDRLIMNGFHVVESWQVWRCQICGGFDSDHEVGGMVGMSHLERYGHESVKPASLVSGATS